MVLNLRYDNQACVTVCAGQSGSGKTTFAFRYLLNVPAACRFIFDDRFQARDRLRITPARTAKQLEDAVPSKWVVFDPHAMFPGNLENAFRFFCQWSFDVSRRGPGKKILLVDEVWRWCSPNNIPQELANVVQTGRTEGLELLCCTQRPQRINGAITNEVTELVCFSIQEPAGLDRITELGADRDAVAALPKGSFISYNCDSGGQLAGKLW
jgi:hypothetical protein